MAIFLYYEGEEIDPDNIPDIMGRNVKEKSSSIYYMAKERYRYEN